MPTNEKLAQIRCTGRDVYIGSTANPTWIKLSDDAYRALVLNGRPAFDRACSQQGSVFPVNDAPNSATFVRIDDKIFIGSANVIKYVELSHPAVLAIFSCGLHALDECVGHQGDWVRLHIEEANSHAA